MYLRDSNTIGNGITLEKSDMDRDMIFEGEVKMSLRRNRTYVTSNSYDGTSSSSC